jgi:hypothetical protein
VEKAVKLLRLGLPGALGALVMLAGAAFFILGLQPLERRHAMLLEQSHSSLKRKANADRNLIPVSSSQGRLASFYAFFQRDELVTDYLAKLYAVAGQAGVEPRTAEYRLAESRSLRLTEYTISMPVTGSYSQIRTFLEHALDEIPVLVLDQASMRRKRVADHLVEADIRFTVFLAQ